MAIASLSRFRCGILAISALILTFPAAQADTVEMKSGPPVTGEIKGVSDGQISINIPGPTGGVVGSVLYLTDVKSVEMTPPAAYQQLKSTTTPPTVVATLQPIIKQYAGLPSDWVLDAMNRLADAYQAQRQTAQATAIYTQMSQLYPVGSQYHNESVVGAAKLDLDAGKADEALAAVKPLIDDADKNIAPSPAEGRLYGGAFLLYGQALQAQKQDSQALEAYLTVETMFYQSPELTARADELVKTLRAQDPRVSVD